jgi:hypothetical protein
MAEGQCTCRALDNGSRWRRKVDAAVQQFHSIESPERPVKDLIDSFEACLHKLAALQTARVGLETTRAIGNVKRLGKNYLMRYILLICFRQYLWEWLHDEWLGDDGKQKMSHFKDWFDHRKELSHLLHHCSL